MRRGRRSSIGYGLSIMSMLFLVAAAFFMPRLVLGIQDKKYMEETYYAPRSGLDYAAINTNYEIDLKQRLLNFAEGYSQGRRYFAVSSDHTMEAPEVDWVSFLNEWLLKIYWDSYVQFLDTINESEVQVKESEFYAIYDEDAVHGAAFMCWKLKVQFKEDFEMNLIIDAKDKTIYFIETNSDRFTDSSSIASNSNLEEDIWFRLYTLRDYYQGDFDRFADSDDILEIKNMNYGNYINLYYDGFPLTLEVKRLGMEKVNEEGISIGIKEIVQLISESE